MFSFLFGDVGSRKSLAQAQTILRLLRRSVRNEKKYKLGVREIWSNQVLNKELSEKYKDRLFYWTQPLEMIFKDYPVNTIIRRNFDCVWDEIATEIPSDRWKETDPEIRRFFAQHRKRGIEIYANTQDYMMLDINARRMATEVWETKKICGSRDISTTLPPLRIIWGLIAKWELDKTCIRADAQDRIRLSNIPDFILITENLCKVFDTTQDIYKEPNKHFVHLTRECAHCGFKKVVHT